MNCRTWPQNLDISSQGLHNASARAVPDGGIDANREQMIELVLKLRLPQGEDGQALGANP